MQTYIERKSSCCDGKLNLVCSECLKIKEKDFEDIIQQAIKMERERILTESQKYATEFYFDYNADLQINMTRLAHIINETNHLIKQNL